MKLSFPNKVVISPSSSEADKRGGDDYDFMKPPAKKARKLDATSIPDWKVVLEKVFIKKDSIAA